MTLTSILPTLRRSIPSPFSRDAWPARAEPTCDDLIVGGVSLSRYVSLCATPCVMTGPAVIPLSGGMPSPTDTTTVFAVRVVEVGDEIGRGFAACAGSGLDARGPVLRIDAVLADLAPRWNEARLIGRISGAADRRFAVADADGIRSPGVAALLPADLRNGDVLVIPCAGAHSVGEVRPRRAPGTAAAIVEYGAL